MRAKEFIIENISDTFYHVTKTVTVPRILEKGITGANPTNFQMAAGGQYGNIGEIFCMTSKKDAIRWAAKWEWQLFNEMGTGKISIVEFKDDQTAWQTDESDPLSQAGNKGKWLKKKGARVSPEQIIGSEPVTIDLIRAATL